MSTEADKIIAEATGLPEKPFTSCDHAALDAIKALAKMGINTRHSIMGEVHTVLLCKPRDDGQRVGMAKSYTGGLGRIHPVMWRRQGPGRSAPAGTSHEGRQRDEDR